MEGMDQIRKVFKRAKETLFIESPIMRSFFANQSFYSNNLKLLSALKMMIFSYCLEVLGSCLSRRSTLLKPILALVMMMAMSLTLLIGLKVKEPEQLRPISIFIVVSGMAYTTILSNDVSSIFEMNYTPIISVITIMFVLCDLGFILPLLLGSTYAIIFVTGSNIRTSSVIRNATRIKYRVEWNQSYIRHDIVSGSVRLVRTKVIFGQISLLTLTILVGFYLSLSNAFIRKVIFDQLLKVQKCDGKIKSWTKQEEQWLNIVMPRYAGHMFKANKFYFQSLENVAIISSEIVNLNKVFMTFEANEATILLNEIIDGFEKSALEYKAERVGSFNDMFNVIIYEPCHDHVKVIKAVMMSASLIKVIKVFNNTTDVKLDIKTVVHYGRVNAFVIGSCRVRLDAFSQDFSLTEKLRTIAKLSSIRITESAYQEIKLTVEVTSGPDLYVSPKSTRTYDIVSLKFGQKLRPSASCMSEQRSEFIENLIQESPESSSESESSQLRKSSYSTNVYIQRENEFKLIKKLYSHSAMILDVLWKTPLHSSLLLFKDPETEWHYCSSLRLSKAESDLILFFDCLVCLSFTTVFIGILVLMCPNNLYLTRSSIGLYLVGFGVVSFMAFILIFYQNLKIDTIHSIVFNPYIRVLIGLYLSSLTTLIMLNIRFIHQMDYYSTVVIQFTLFIFSFIPHLLYTGVYSFLRQISTGVMLIMTFMCFFNIPEINDFKDLYNSDCSTGLFSHYKGYSFGIRSNIVTQFILLLILVVYVTRSNEKTTRTHFLVSREIGIKTEEAEKTEIDYHLLLVNLFPNFILENSLYLDNLKPTDIRYARDCQDVGVLFANIGNFFTEYYYEDGKGGEEAIKVLHSIVCTFDSLLEKFCFSKLEKVKSFGSWFIVAVGINDSTRRNTVMELAELLLFGINMKKTLTMFNHDKIAEVTTFKLQIGLHFGTVIGGVVGHKKPMFDIWGEDVMIAKTLSEKAKPDSILTTAVVKEKLKKSFHFQSKGSLIINKKGTEIYTVDNV